MIRYYVDDGASVPEPVECDPPGWPHRDAKGREQFDNSHFDTEAAAWKQLAASGAACVSLSNDHVLHAKRELRRALRHLAQRVARNEKIRKGVEAFEMLCGPGEAAR